jgi:hypothetical protein
MDDVFPEDLDHMLTPAEIEDLGLDPSDDDEDEE